MKKLLRIITIYFAVVSTITFSMFILEESIQMCTFGTWPAQDAGAWVLVEQNLQKMEAINKTLYVINITCGWLQPFAFISYASYVDATKAYIDSLRQKIATVRPAALVGRTITIVFTPTSADIDQNGQLQYRLGALTAYKCGGINNTTGPITTTGIITETTDGKYILNCR